VEKPFIARLSNRDFSSACHDVVLVYRLLRNSKMNDRQVADIAYDATTATFHIVQFYSFTYIVGTTRPVVAINVCVLRVTP
jgi:hypothetical protein